jgi:hypothetical protein
MTTTALIALLLTASGQRVGVNPNADVSHARVTSTGGTTARALRDRFADTWIVTDFGAACDGTTDDTSAIQAALNKARDSAIKKVRIPASTVVSSALVIHSGTWLDVDPAATVWLKTGSTGNMLRNAASVVSVRAVSDAAITAGSATLTSATAAFTSADVGRSIEVAGANAGGVSLWTTIAAVTNGTTATLATAAVTSVSGAAASLWNRDSDITVTGGTWDRGSATGADPTGKHSLLFRHVDLLTIRDTHIKTGTGAKYAIAIGDAVDVHAQRLKFTTASDGIHFQGPASRITVRDVTGVATGDDTVAFTARDYTQFDDVHGDIIDVLVDGVRGSSQLAQVKVIGGTGTVLRRMTIRNLDGSGGTYGVIVSDDTTGATDMDGLLIESVMSSAAEVVYLGTTGGRNATVRDVRLVYPRAAGSTLVKIGGVWESVTVAGVTRAGWIAGSHTPIGVTGTVGSLSLSDVQIALGAAATTANNGIHLGGTFGSVRIDGVSADVSNGVQNESLITIPTEGTVSGALEVSGLRATYSGAATKANHSSAGVLNVSGQVGSVVVRGFTSLLDAADTGSNVIRVGSTGVVGRLSASGVHAVNGRAVIETTAGGSVGSIRLDGSYAESMGRLANVFVSTDMTLDDVASKSHLNAPIYVSGATLTLRGHTFQQLTSITNGIQRGATETVRVIHPDFPVNLAILAKADGDVAFNTNAALACGVGRVISNGTNWKNVYSGLTY